MLKVKVCAAHIGGLRANLYFIRKKWHNVVVWSVICVDFEHIIFFYIQFKKFTMTKLPKTLTTNYCTTLQGRYQEEQDIMTTPWHLT